MRVLVLGSGAREHALAARLTADGEAQAVVCAPGNPGMTSLGPTAPVDLSDPDSAVALAAHQQIDLTIVGPELPLSRGVVDRFVKERRLIFGPSQAAARLETSKAFAKSFMARHQVPTARFETCDSADDALAIVRSGVFGFPLVLKADGLAAGKGVVIASDRTHAVGAISALMSERRFGAAGDRVVIEECLTGHELSFFVMSDGERAMPLASAQDHKRIFDDDQGPNTGGMGAFAPSVLLDASLEAQIVRDIVEPVIAGMAAEGNPFRGFLYVGLMVTADGPKVIEFNVRLGDPEAQVILPLIDQPLLPLIAGGAEGRLPRTSCRVGQDKLVGVAIASRGYPESSESGQPIRGIAEAERTSQVPHAGTAWRNGDLVTAGGRVLTVVGRGPTFADAIARAYAGVEKIHFDGMQVQARHRTESSAERGLKYSVITFGCRVNQADSLGFEEQLRAQGATCEAPDQADLIIVNTCSVTASADQGARQTVRRLARTNPTAKVVVTGCYATRRPEEFCGAPNVLRVVPNDEKSRLLTYLATDFGLTTAQRFGDGEGSCGADIEPGVAGRTAFTLRVQTGCAQPCSYCIIPSTRGEPRSLQITEILTQVRRVIDAGFKEIVLTGVHLGSYGRDLMPSSSLVELLRALGREAAASSEPFVRFRISSLEPMDCSSEVVDLVADCGIFAPHFHLPLQHASDRLLAAMRRPYAVDRYAALVNDIRARMPSASIGSDIIIGFPGEHDEDFEELCRYLAQSPLTHLHVFPYSDRPGTVASSMSGKVPGGVIRARAERVREIGHRLTSGFRRAQLGTIHRALTIGDGAVAVTGNYLKVRIPPGCDRNEWVRVKITEAGESMAAEIVQRGDLQSSVDPGFSRTVAGAAATEDVPFPAKA